MVGHAHYEFRSGCIRLIVNIFLLLKSGPSQNSGQAENGLLESVWTGC